MTREISTRNVSWIIAEKSYVVKNVPYCKDMEDSDVSHRPSMVRGLMVMDEIPKNAHFNDIANFDINYNL